MFSSINQALPECSLTIHCRVHSGTGCFPAHRQLQENNANCRLHRKHFYLQNSVCFRNAYSLPLVTFRLLYDSSPPSWSARDYHMKHIWITKISDSCPRPLSQVTRQMRTTSGQIRPLSQVTSQMRTTSGQIRPLSHVTSQMRMRSGQIRPLSHVTGQMRMRQAKFLLYHMSQAKWGRDQAKFVLYHMSQAK